MHTTGTRTEHAGISAPSADSVGWSNARLTGNGTIEYNTTYSNCWYLQTKKGSRRTVLVTF